jgi:hypothetical protein
LYNKAAALAIRRRQKARRFPAENDISPKERYFSFPVHTQEKGGYNRAVGG